MDWEKMELDVQANHLGWQVVKPPLARGESSVVHKFDFLADTSTVKYAFDVYPEVTEIEVLNSYIKKIDTKSIVNLVCASGKDSEAASRLAAEYGMKILKTQEIPAFFESLVLAKPNGPTRQTGFVPLSA